MKRIKHRVNDPLQMITALKEGYDGVECDVQFDREHRPVLCHDAADANQPGHYYLDEIETIATEYPKAIFFVEIKPCTWNRHFMGNVLNAVEHVDLDKLFIISFDISIVELFSLYGFQTAPIGRERKGLSVMRADQKRSNAEGHTYAVYGGEAENVEYNIV
jgi:glycerophosphoryl diester phosphodiesterase